MAAWKIIKMRYIIKKQILELNIDERLNYFQVQQQVSDRYWNEIVPVLEKSFNTIGNEDKVIAIDKLELDLGVISERKLRSHEFIREVTKIIEEKISALADTGSAMDSVKSVENHVSVFFQWLYYMDHGYLAWNSDTPSEKWNTDVIKSLDQDQALRLILLKRLTENHDFLKRFVNLHDDALLGSFFKVISETGQEDISVYVGELIGLSSYLAEKGIADYHEKRLRNKLWQDAFKIRNSKQKKVFCPPLLQRRS
jgi:hypothetical protein